MDLKDFQLSLDKCIEHLLNDMSQIHTGRATPELIEEVKVNAYGAVSPMKALANISISDAKSLLVQPWDKSILEAIEKGINASNLGFLPSIEGEYVRVKIPDLTEERRKEFVRIMKERVEACRVSIRNVRQEFMQETDMMIESGMSEDEGKRSKEEAEKMVKAANEKVEEMREKKESELMTV
ncbi:MAG: Ribosome-recycling factor [candidate division WS6 bacterium GW2011_GWF2_39_15]|uniref:Ribosome-recycling factor n=1 Tax=candidate division WS6 bacterium GW2011_GWF2_39_15 TaxID=1619100 RepID=A0A0G0QXJ8_9BACT|nr:MAG: Ribosome-recycling factor [candidate division WS6 bacterium GW2011_GWF2_39_15]